MKTTKILLIICLIALFAFSIGCSAVEAINDPIYAKTIYTWNGTAYQQVTVAGGGGVEVDPIWLASDAFHITAAEILAWNTQSSAVTDGWLSSVDWNIFNAYTGSPASGITAADILGWDSCNTTGFIPYVGATSNINLNAKEVTNGIFTSVTGNGTWTALGTWKLPAMYFNGDITTDRWLSSNFNTFLGIDVVGNGNLVHTVGGTGYNNTAVGYHALYSANTSWYNSAFGSGALQSNTEGYFNSAFGTDAMSFNIDGTFNSAFGVGALSRNTSGSFNTAVGVSASGNNTTGMYNTAIGEMAGYNNSAGDRNVFIGYSAGENEIGSDKLYIDNSNTLTPLIYGDFSTNDLTFNGDLHIVASSIDMSQIGVEPSSTANRAGIYAIDLSVDNCTIGFFTETAVESALGHAVTKRMPIRWNGATYYLLAEASGWLTPLVSSVEPTVEEGAVVGMVFFNTATNTWKKCTSLSPLTWDTLSSGGATAWGSITGNITYQTDLNDALGEKLSIITGTALDNVFSSNGLLKRTGTGTYTIDESNYLTSFTELDPIFGDSIAHGIVAGDITNWNNKLSSITGSGLDNVFSSNGLLKRTGTATYTLDTSTYLTANQNITLSSDASGSGTTSIAVTNTGLKGVALPALATGYLYYSGSAWAFQTPAGAAHDLGGALHNADTLANLNLKISDADVVALAGQLGGTAASPDVRGLRESGGQLLTMGAVADGQYLLRSGTTIISGSPGGGSPPAWKGNIVGAFSSGDPELLLSSMQNAGVVSPTPTNITATVARIAYFKLDTAITVNKIRWYGVGATTGLYHVAVYRDSDSARLAVLDDFNTVLSTWGSGTFSVSLAANTLYFLAVSVDTTGTTPGVLAMGTTAAAATGMITLPTNWPGNLDINAASPKIDPTGFAQFAVTAGALPATAPARVNRNTWTGGMPAFFLDNNNS